MSQDILDLLSISRWQFREHGDSVHRPFVAEEISLVQSKKGLRQIGCDTSEATHCIINVSFGGKSAGVRKRKFCAPERTFDNVVFEFYGVDLHLLFESLDQLIRVEHGNADLCFGQIDHAIETVSRLLIVIVKYDATAGLINCLLDLIEVTV